MKAYSLDLRQKIVDTYLNEERSQRQLATRFRVSKSFIIKLLKQYRETGEIKPLAHDGGARLNDATLEELCQIFEAKTSLTISRGT